MKIFKAFSGNKKHDLQSDYLLFYRQSNVVFNISQQKKALYVLLMEKQKQIVNAYEC